jgi:signal transduction histidine kinase/DNA-binding response OmpR family regulator/HAMP domain-containing protein
MDWFKNIKIQNKLFIAFGIPTVLVAILVIFVIVNNDNIEKKYNELIHSPLQRQEYLGNAVACLSEVRRFVLSRGYYDDEFADTIREYYYDNYQKPVESFMHNISAYRNILRNDSYLSDEERQERLDAVDYISALFGETYLQYIDHINEASPESDRALLTVLLLELIPIGDDLTEKLNELRLMAATSAEKRIDETRGYLAVARRQTVAIAACIAILALFASVFMSQVIKGPIITMEKAMAEISRGNLAYPIRSAYRDELGMLSNSIGDMVDTISELNKSVSILDFLDVMIFVNDFDYNILYMNRRMAEARGIDRNSCINKKCYNVTKVGFTEPCPFCPLQQLLAEKEKLPSAEISYNWDEQLGIWVNANSSIIRWVDGSFALLTVIKDDTLRKEHEEQQQKHHEELREAATAAQAASVAKSAFLANMSHEIRTPMNSIIGFSELAMDGAVSPKTNGYLSKILENAQWLLQIINDILDISKIESGKMVLESIPFNLHELFVSCRTTMMPKAVEKGIALQFYAEPSIGKKLLGDPTRLRQAILNLMSNAVKFTVSGVVKLSATVNGLPTGNITVHFEVRDSGIGMTDEQIEKIFDPFTQAETGTTRKYGGTGLGLAITKNIVEMMGGQLSVESIPGVGSKFSFELTFDTVDSPEEDIFDNKILLEEFEKPVFEGEVLLCEDNVMNQQVICEHLARVGLKAAVAENGKIGVDMVKSRMEKGEKQFDLILMDMHMPVMDGLEAAAKIFELNTGVPVVAMTANIMSNDMDSYRTNGMDDCLGKPFTSHELWRCLLKYLTPVDRKIVQKNAQIEADSELQKSIRTTFVKSNQKKIEEITKAVEAGDINLAHRLAHTLKGNAGQIGKTSLQKAAADVEHLLKEGKNQLTEEHLKFLENELTSVLNELAPLPGEPSSLPASQTGHLEARAALELLEKLELMLKTGSSKSLKHIDTLRLIPESEKLIQQIEDFDFEEAFVTLGELKKNWELA